MSDLELMRRALSLAEQGRYTVSPNPMVGCVIERDGAVIADGWHERAGEPHAEAHALRKAAHASRGATMYVTLEPCAHHGRTPPCSEAVVASGVKRVVVAMEDPDDRVRGRGIAAIRSAGITVEIGVCESEARRLNEKFVWSKSQGLPFVVLKAGVTLDGKLATATRESQWITGEEARQRSLALREEMDAILVGSGTVRTDNPRLTRRLGLAGSQQPWTRVVIDGDGELAPHAQIFSDGARTILFTSKPESFRPSDTLEIIATNGRVDFPQLLTDLHARGLQSLLVEGGSVVHSEIIRQGLWQKMILFVAPMLLGGPYAPALLGGDGVQRLSDAHRFRFDHVEVVGNDLMIVAYPS